MSGRHYPSCWNADQWTKFKTDYTWLHANDGKLGCTVCRDVGALGPNRSAPGQRVQLAIEWMQCRIQPYGDTRDKQAAALRKKLYEHRNSVSHNMAVSVQARAANETLKTAVVEQQKGHIDITCRVFRTVYYICQNNRPFLDHSGLIDLQVLNGLQLGRMLHGNLSATNICDHIAREMRRKLVAAVINAKLPLSVLIDESTSLGQKSCLIVYLKCSVDACSEPLTVFLDLLELSSLTADGIVSTLMQCLHDHGFTDEILHECWIALATDGASVMLGKNAGVFVKLKRTFPNLIGWHCFNHRLELSVHDAVKACTEVNHFKTFMLKLYTIYSASPKNRRALEQCAAEVGSELLKIGRILGVRWVASSFRSVKAVWVSYAALHAHFSSSHTASIDAKDRAMFSGMAKKLSSSAFLLNLAFMYDALEELADLSESLQNTAINMQKANRLVTRQIEVFSARKNNEGGEHYQLACKAVSDGTFHGVQIVERNSVTDKIINKNQFYQSLVDSLTARMMSESDRTVSECVGVVFPTEFPSTIAIEYGEKELKQACSTFLVPYSVNIKQEYRDFKDSAGVGTAGSNLKRLLHAINTVPVSTAECERGFSRMNLICTPLRSQLTVDHMSSLLFISTAGPPLEEWNPLPYVRSWLAQGRHAATDLGKARLTADLEIPEGRKAVWKCF